MSDGRKYYCFCMDNCKFETMTKEQILAAIAQAAETGLVFDTEAAFITKVKESNAGSFVTFWVGTTAQYNALKEHDPNCVYIKTDDKTEEELGKRLAAIEASVPEIDITLSKSGAAADALVTGDNIRGLKNRATALENTAPSKYGLGTSAISINPADLDSIATSGWYRINNQAATFGGFTHNYWLILVNVFSEKRIVQELYPISSTLRCKLVRWWRNDAAVVEEWENPPMQYNVEYRTTERYLGKPVYTKLIKIDQLPSDTGTLGVAYISSEKVNVIDCRGYMVSQNEGNGVVKYPYPIIRLETQNSYTVKAWIQTHEAADYTAVYVHSVSDYSDCGAEFIVKYTK